MVNKNTYCKVADIKNKWIKIDDGGRQDIHSQGLKTGLLMEENAPQ